jgi:hypothetical protein
MKKFVEIDANQVRSKVGWEMEACFELKRAAESPEGQMVLVYNNGMFDKPGHEPEKGTYEVGISMDATGDFKDHKGLTKKEADQIFESYL